jgi:hypothetical protein
MSLCQHCGHFHTSKWDGVTIPCRIIVHDTVTDQDNKCLCGKELK